MAAHIFDFTINRLIAVLRKLQVQYLPIIDVNARGERARETGPTTFEKIPMIVDLANVTEQPMQTAGAMLSIADIHSLKLLEKHAAKRFDNIICLMIRPSISMLGIGMTFIVCNQLLPVNSSRIVRNGT